MTAAPPTVRFSCVVPAYDEAGAIGPVIAELAAAAARCGVPAEIVVVDDCSRDATSAEAHAAAESAPVPVRVIRNPVNLGYGHTLMRGIDAARGDLIGIIDADGSYSADAFPALVAQMEAGADHAIAARTGPHFQRPWSKRHIYRMLCGYVAGRHVPDANSGLRVFRRALVDDLRRDLCLGFSFTTSLTLSSLLVGYVVTFTPVEYRRRIGRSHVRLRDVFRTTQFLVQLIAAYNPFKLFLPVLGLTALSGAAVAWWAAERSRAGAADGTVPLIVAIVISTVMLEACAAVIAYVSARAVPHQPPRSTPGRDEGTRPAAGGS